MVATQVWHLEKTKKVLVQINGNGQGNDSGSNLLVRFLGQLAQKSAFCPVSVERWDEMSEDSSIEQWKCIEDHFEFDYAAGIKWVRSTLGDRWKAYKYQLRCHYFLPNKSKDEILATLPPGVDHVEWAAFVHHYKSETMKKLSEQNSKNRKNLKVSHAGGSKSNARRTHQMEQKLGRPVCRSEVKLSTLLKKNGSYVSEEGKVMAVFIPPFSLLEDHSIYYLYSERLENQEAEVNLLRNNTTFKVTPLPSNLFVAFGDESLRSYAIYFPYMFG